MTFASALKAHVRKSIKRARTFHAKVFRAFEPADLERVLRDIGVAAGDTVLLHSGFDEFAGFTGKPSDVLAVLQRLITPDGILMLPTLPFTGTAVDYVQSDPVFDPIRTPSRMGLLTELFRRMPNVVRSIHPTHAVAAWGNDAAAVIAAHHLAATPCGAGTPYARLLDRRGKILLLGVDIRSATFYHTVEELLEERFPDSPFTTEPFRLKSRTRQGELVETLTRLYEPSVSRRRNLFRLVPYLKQRGAWRERRLGGVKIVLLNARDMLETVRIMADKGVFCYE